MKKRICFLITLMICMIACTNCFALTKLHETVNTKVINSGTNLKTYTRLTDKGWLSINIIEVDLNDKNTSLGLLTSSNGLQTFQNVKTMITNSNKNVVAAINADFFNGKTQKGNIIGMTIEDGEVLTSTYYENEVKDVLASFTIDEDNNVLFDYFTNKITLTNNNNDEAIAISEINKWSSNYEYPVLYTSKWGEKSLGSTSDLVLTELVVEKGKVKEVRYNEEPATIPEDGYVISALGNAADAMSKYFKVGNKVSLDIDMKLDIDKIKLAVSGGTLLVKDGVATNFTHIIYGSNPRTAVGVSKDGETFYLITVDGRQAKSIGLTQTELAELLVEKGIYTAMNLDGGGSTTMVVRQLGDESYTIQNSPSDKTLRNVPNAIAVFNNEKTGSLDKLVIEVNDVNVFVGCKKELTVKGYDKYYNPVTIDTQKIKWSYDGVPVDFKDGVLVAGNEAGSTTITASIGKAKGSFNIDVLSMPNELTISPKKIAVAKNENVTFKVSGQNKNGYYGDLRNDEVIWEVETGNGSIKDGVFTASEAGDYIISVSIGNAKSYALVSVDASKEVTANDFEKENFFFKAYPEEVLGDAKLSNEQVYSGKNVAKLDYDFTKTSKTRAAYLRFDDSITLDKNAKAVKFMMYATASTSDQIKLKITDANNTTKYAVVCKGLESSGWQELEFDLSDIALPAKLVDIYVAQDNSEELTSGTVYFDDLKIVYDGATVTSTELLPRDIKGADALCVESEFTATDSYKIVVAPSMNNGILLEHLKNKKLEEVINKNSKIVIMPKQNDENLLANIAADKIVPKAYDVKNYKYATVISLNIADGGLRVTDSNQWISLKKDTKEANKNVLIVMNGNLEDFTDSMEKSLFIDVLCDLRRNSGKNIWVIQTGDNTDYSMKRGVKYLSIGDGQLENPDLQAIKDTNYIEITVNPDKMTYEIKNVW